MNGEMAINKTDLLEKWRWYAAEALSLMRAKG